eukprot:3513480-Prymnesium_polylepis.1
MSSQQKQFVPLRNQRGIRVLEYLLPTTPRSECDTLLRWGQSLLITKLRLGQPTKHHVIDLAMSNAEHRQTFLNNNINDKQKLRNTPFH